MLITKTLQRTLLCDDMHVCPLISSIAIYNTRALDSMTRGLKPATTFGLKHFGRYVVAGFSPRYRLKSKIDDTWTVGTRLDPYVLVSPIGAGGMDTSLNTQPAGTADHGYPVPAWPRDGERSHV